MTQSCKFNLYGRDVNIDQVVNVLRELSIDIKMIYAAKTSNNAVISCEAPIDVYTSIFGATLVEKECTYLNCLDHTRNEKYLETTAPPQLPEKLKPYVQGIVDANNHQNQEDIDSLNQLLEAFKH
ncbi:MAG: hypothetical protein AABW48_00820 [Nanoarchaeota archaeon]